jgi:hypothetical protein
VELPGGQSKQLVQRDRLLLLLTRIKSGVFKKISPRHSTVNEMSYIHEMANFKLNFMKSSDFYTWNEDQFDVTDIQQSRMFLRVDGAILTESPSDIWYANERPIFAKFSVRSIFLWIWLSALFKTLELSRIWLILLLWDFVLKMITSINWLCLPCFDTLIDYL